MNGIQSKIREKKNNHTQTSYSTCWSMKCHDANNMNIQWEEKIAARQISIYMWLTAPICICVV